MQPRGLAVIEVVAKELMKIEEKKMTTDSHSRGSERCHSRRYEKKDAKSNGKKISQEEIGKEIVELEEQLNVLRRIFK